MEIKSPEVEEAKRAQLAAKLDADLDTFMNELAAKSARKEREKPFDFEEWCRQVDQHPAFMKELKKSCDEEGGEYSVELQAIQALKYDQDDPIECGTAHKEEGNRHFAARNYHLAIKAYTKGIQIACSDVQLNSTLYANRAAANRYLGNLRSAIRDCVSARRFQPDNFKVILRGAECLLELNRGIECLEWIDQSSPEKFSNDNEKLRKLAELKEKAEKRRIIEERDQRRQRAMERKARIEYEQFSNELVLNNDQQSADWNGINFTRGNEPTNNVKNSPMPK